MENWEKEDTEMEEEMIPEEGCLFIHEDYIDSIFIYYRIMKEEVKPEKRLSSDISVGAL